MKVILAIDSMKGCLSSHEACLAAADGIHQVFPQAETLCIPLADGGEGMMKVLEETLKLHAEETIVHGPLMESIKAKYYTDNAGTALIEMAATAGLTLVDNEKRNPRKTTTYGLGEQMQNAIQRGCRNLIIGIGGSCTNDGGTGMLQALGYRFINKEGKEIPCPMCGEKLNQLKQIERSPLPPDLNIQVACDVQNPLYGPQGAACVFAAQKGANEEDISLLDNGLRNWGNLEREYVPHAGDGAAGGLGYALREYLGAHLESGVQIIMNLLHFDERIQGADLIITGEGCSDRQTLMGKVPMGVLSRGKKYHIPTALIAGEIHDKDELMRAGFECIHCINEGTDLDHEECMKPKVAKENIRKSTASFIGEILGGKKKNL
ncbi:MAG: glycerate kinase [Bacteroidaceae bacterium]|nr:glycerate kinase [Bacteroidaceae bacterium]